MTYILYLRFGINCGMRIGNNKNISKTTGGGCLRTRLKSFFMLLSGLSKMDMHVDESGSDQQSRRIEDLAILGWLFAGPQP